MKYRQNALEATTSQVRFLRDERGTESTWSRILVGGMLLVTFSAPLWVPVLWKIFQTM